MSTHTKKIGVTTATIIGMNAMIGSGIFSAPASMAFNVGPAGILAYAFVIIAIWFIAQSLGRLAYLFPQESSFYTYTKQWGGHTLGMAANASYLAGILIAMSLLTQMTGSYLHKIFPSYTASQLGTAILILLLVLNMFGARFSRIGQHFLIVCTIFPLIATIPMCLAKFNLNNIIPFAPYGLGNVIKVTRVVIFGFFGFECATALSNVIENPKKNLPKALSYAVLLVGTIYILFIGSIIGATPTHVFTNPDVLLTDILRDLFPAQHWLITVIHSAIISAILGTIHSLIWASSNLLIFLTQKSRHIPSPQGFSKQLAIVCVGAAVLMNFTVITNTALFFYFTALGHVFPYITSMITLLTMKKEWRSRQNIKTLMGLAAALAIFVFALEGVIVEIGNLL